jgi:hypothetical protein
MAMKRTNWAAAAFGIGVIYHAIFGFVPFL